MPTETAEVIDTLVDGRGVARSPGKTVFIAGALHGERVEFIRRKKRRNFDEAELVEILRTVPERVEPACEYFGVCGGCSLQHLGPSHQLELKQSVLLENLERIGTVRPQQILTPISAEPFSDGTWAYRRKARLAVKYVERKGRVLVGFRERNNSFVADMLRCETLHPGIGERLADLVDLIDGLSIRDRIPQIEAAAGDNAVAMIFRVLSPPNDADIAKFAAFGSATGVSVYLQSKGPDTIEPLPGGAKSGAPCENLYYRLPNYDVTINFMPMDFLQVHAEVNRAMVDQAVALLDPQPDARVLDLFCGLGNFSLPMATRAAEVVGVEIAADMVMRARANALDSDIGNAVFHEADLAEPPEAGNPFWEGFDSVVLDPPRTGAGELMDALGNTGAGKILYVSCHPGTLARDAKVLVHELGYDLAAAGVVDMFPHTAHVESMALFRK